MNPYLQKPIDFANSMANSFYWGFGPEIYGLLTANPHPWKRGSLELYRQNRDAHRRYLNNIQQNSPATHVAGDVAGGLLLAGGMGKAMHTMGQDILRKAFGRQPPPVDMSKPIHTQQELVDMSRRNFGRNMAGVGALAAGGVGAKGLLEAASKTAAPAKNVGNVALKEITPQMRTAAQKAATKIGNRAYMDLFRNVFLPAVKKQGRETYGNVSDDVILQDIENVFKSDDLDEMADLIDPIMDSYVEHLKKQGWNPPPFSSIDDLVSNLARKVDNLKTAEYNRVMQTLRQAE